jgi:hypothetical protein
MQSSMNYGGPMGTNISLVTDASALEIRQHGPAIAGICLITESGTFPQVGWSDFVVVLLGWWSGALLKVLHNEHEQVRVHFMDGPYAVDLSRSAGSLQFSMIARDRDVGSGQAAVKPFAVEFILQSRTVLDACRLRRWWSADAETLESLLGELEDQISHL